MLTLGYTEDLKFLLEQGIGINTDFFIRLASDGQIELLAIPLRKGIDINSRNSEGKTALFGATWRYLDAVKFLVENGADPSLKNQYNQSPLFNAIVRGNIEIVKYLLPLENNINVQDVFGNSLLMAVFYDYIVDDDTPILKARSKKKLRTELVQLLLEHGVSPHLFNNKDVNALYLAQYTETTDVIDLLYKYGAGIKRKVDFKHFYL
ncbi:MAG: ankyrin repeat domain-containing protein [Brevinema sp.]